MNCNDSSHCKDLCTVYHSMAGAVYKDSRPCFHKRHHASSQGGTSMWVLIMMKPKMRTFLRPQKVYQRKVWICSLLYQQTWARNESRLYDWEMSWKRCYWLLEGCEGIEQGQNGATRRTGASKIAELWKQHYSELFNCVKSDLYKVGNVANSDTVGITCRVVQQAITQQADNKASGLDQITAEHLTSASQRAAAPLAICFTGFMTHGL